MEPNIKPNFKSWSKPAILLSALIILTAMLIACGDVTSTPAVTTAGVTSEVPTTQPATAAPTATQKVTATTTTTTTAAAVPPATTVAAMPSTPPAGSSPPVPLFEDRTTPPNLVKTFYNAINRKEYQRAFSYWQVTGTANSPASYDQFAKGYADTASVTYTLGEITQDAGAGQLYAIIPTVLVATHTNGKQETFSGCYIVHRVNKGISANPADELWGFRSGTLSAAAAGAQPNVDSCNLPGESRVTGPFTDQSSPENLVKAFYNAISLNDFQRAYTYWEKPGKGTANTPGSFDQFPKGYADTAMVSYILGQITSDAGAGQLYASVPIVLTSVHTDGTTTTFTGCYIAHRVNDGISSTPADSLWRFRSGTLAVASANAQPDPKSCKP